MGLETKHINLLRSCSNWLRGRSNTVVARNLGWSSLMLEYAKDLDEIADHLQAMELPETVVTLDDLFKGKKK